MDYIADIIDARVRPTKTNVIQSPILNIINRRFSLTAYGLKGKAMDFLKIYQSVNSLSPVLHVKVGL